jgi:hypothetical protein
MNIQSQKRITTVALFNGSLGHVYDDLAYDEDLTFIA